MNLAARGIFVCAAIWLVALVLVLGAADQHNRPFTALVHRLQCSQNQHRIGKAYFAYANDHAGKFPVVLGPAAVGGVKGDLKGKTKPLPQIVARLYGATIPEKERPLNKYVANVKVFHCPADRGGGAYNVPSSWKTFGNSYQVQAGDDLFRVQHVAGLSTEKEGSAESKPITMGEIAKSPENKIIQGDWNWPYDKDDAWHGMSGLGHHVMLFGDGHTEWFLFPPTKVMMKWLLAPKPDPNYRWW